MKKSSVPVRKLVLVLGDQLNRNSAVFDDFDPKQDWVWMAEVYEEATHVWSHKARIALFLSAMRHYRESLEEDGMQVHYSELKEKDNKSSFSGELKSACEQLKPEKLLVVEPGEYRVQQALQETSKELNLPLEILPDRHFLSTKEEFTEFAKGRKALRMEYFYRQMRQKHNVLMEGDDPVGERWNFDAENRGSFGKEGPEDLPTPKKFKPDKITKEVLDLVQTKFASHPGNLEHFDWPVTAKEAEQALQDFINNRLANFGTYQDAMWTQEPFLYHSRISSALNLKLLDPRPVITAAEDAYNKEKAPIEAVEGFIRQILGWREYIRGIYWNFMPDYGEMNELNAKEKLPEFFWTGDTDMVCLREAIGQTLEYGYAHHIQRLMVTGLFSLLLGVHPRAIHEWYLAVYVDAVEWVELPNVLGMSQYADGGKLASKPYAATGKYIQRMSNYCKGCRYNPAESTGEKACPFTTLYWDFLLRHEKKLAKNQRMSLQVRNLDRLSKDKKQAIKKQAKELKQSLAK